MNVKPFAPIFPMVLALAACGGGSSSADASGSHDLGKGTDSSASTPGCAKTTALATWPSTHQTVTIEDPMILTYDYDLVVTDHEPNAGDSTLYDSLSYEYYHHIADAAPMVPRTVTLTAAPSYFDCDECMYISIGRSDTIDGTPYLSQTGTLQITAEDSAGATGTVTVSGTNIHLVEWNIANSADAKVDDGDCYDVGSFSYTGTWTRTVDGGT